MRPKGSRNAGFDERRAALLERLRERLIARDAPLPTLRALAAAAGCGISTLTHYFGRREDIVRAVFDDIATSASDDRHAARTAMDGFSTSIHAETRRAVGALGEPHIADSIAMGLTEGMGHAVLGPAFLDTILEPFIVAIADKCRDHIDRGEMEPVDPRFAAISLLSPLLIAALHQRGLGGAECLPLDMDALGQHVAEGFIRAWERAPAA